LGGYRVIHVEAKEKGYSKLSVRTRSGYYPRVEGAASAPSSSTTDRTDPGFPQTPQ
jgi:hypothetical protein